MSTKASERPGPSAFFVDDHRRCDQLWGRIESLVEAGEEGAAREAWNAFEAAMQRHFSMEEEVLFPAVEAATGMGGGMGPTAVMRAEHDQMKGVLAQMGQAAAGDLQELLDHGDTLLMLIQQHNTKEEGILYPMCDQTLQPVWSQIAEKLDQY